MRYGAIVIVLFLVGCASTAQGPVPTVQAGQGAVGIEVGIRPPLPLQTYSAEWVFFAQADDQGEPDLAKLYVTGHARGGRAYLLNVPPGRYVAVAGAFTTLGDRYISYFPRALIVQTIANVDEHRMAFAGRFLLDSDIGGVCPGKADPLQIRVAEALSPGVPKCGLLRMAIHQTLSNPVVVIGGSAFPLGSVKVHYGGILREADRTENATRSFGTAADSDLRDAGWRVRLP